MQKITRIAALLLVALAIVLAIMAFGLSRSALKQEAATPAAAIGIAAPAAPDRTATPAGPSMVLAADTLPAGEPIDAASLRTVNLSKAAPGSYADIAEVTGDVPLVDIPPGTPITSGLLAHGVAMLLKPGERALAVPVDELAGAGNRIVPGDYVDVFLNLKASQSTGIANTSFPAQTRLLLSRMRVLAYGSQDLPPLPRKDGASDGDKNPAKPGGGNASPRSAVLAVPLDMASRLLLGAQSGTLSLALRHPDDAGQPDGALFPQPRTALSPLAGLSAEQRQQLATPANRAYAGIDGAGLAGQAGNTRATPSPATSRVTTAPSLEIIRGTRSSARRPSP